MSKKTTKKRPAKRRVKVECYGVLLSNGAVMRVFHNPDVAKAYSRAAESERVVKLTGYYEVQNAE